MENTTNQPKYLVAEEDRYNAIINDTLDKFQFEHQEASEVDAFKNGIFENRIDINPFGIPVYLSLQDNDGAGLYIRQNSSLIETAAREFQINSDFLKAVIYTEMSRGWYDDYNPFGSPTVLPGNLNKKWEALIPGSDVNNKNDNIRLTAKLLSEIAERLDYPYPEDIYSLYNGLGHDRTYEISTIKT